MKNARKKNTVSVVNPSTFGFEGGYSKLTTKNPLVAGLENASNLTVTENAALAPRTGRYSDDKFVASFVGFVPANNPAVLVAVVVDEPMVNHAGGVVAAPVFRRVAQMVLEHKGMTPPSVRRANISDLASRPDPANVAYEVIRQAQGDHQSVQDSVARGKLGPGFVRVPDMIGWPMREVLHQVSELGLMPQVQGTGLLSRQEPAPGQALEKGAALTLHFEPPS